MRIYKKSTVLPLVAAALFTAISAVNFFNQAYGSAIAMIILSGLWLVGYYLNQRPYIQLGEGKMILGRGLFKPHTFNLSDLAIVKIDKGSVTFTRQGKDPFSILLTVMNKKTQAEFLTDLQSSLKKSNRQG